MLTYFTFRLAAFLAQYLPERWGMALARGLGSLIYRLSPVAAAGRDNARHVLGADTDPASVSQLAKRMFQNRLLAYYDLVRLPRLPLEEINQRVTFEGLEHIDQAVKEKRGAVVVSGHIGPIETMIQAVAALDYPLLGIAEHLEPQRLHTYMMDLRTAHGLHIISTQGPLLDIYRRIKQGEVLLSAADRDSTGTGVIMDFFGAPAWVPDGYARLAVRADVPLIYGVCHRETNGLDIKIYPPIYPNHTLGKKGATQELLRQTLHFMEQAIRRHPEEWHLSTPVWQLAREKRANMEETKEAER